jgi:hypothetical protein
MPPSGGYNPKVANPHMSNNIPQMRSETLQKPFYFGGSQVPVNLGLKKGQYSGSGFSGDAPPKHKQVFRDDGKPINRVLKYPNNAVGMGVHMPLKR